MSFSGNQGQDHKEQVFFSYQRKQEQLANKNSMSGNKMALAMTQGRGPVGNKNHTNASINAKNLENDHESTKVKTISHDIKVWIQKGRQAKNWTQKDLAQQINEKQSIITDYETGRAVPNEQILQKIEKVLMIYIRGSKAGQPIEAKKTKKQRLMEAQTK